MSDLDGRPPIIPAVDFDGCEPEAPIASLDLIDMTTISVAFHHASTAVRSPCDKIYGLLRDISGMYLSPGDPGGAWRAGFSSSDGRTMIPSDIRGEQSDVLEEVLPRFKHPALRARIADILWTNDTRKAAIAKVAIDSYCDCVEGLMDGSLKTAYPVDGRDLMDAQTPAHRALQIARQTKKSRAPLPARLVSVMAALYDKALSDAQPVIFNRVAQLCVDNRIIEPTIAAADLEKVAEAGPDFNPIALRAAVDFASILYRKVGDHESQQRCHFSAVLQTLRMRDECSHAGAKASWVMEALQRLRHMHGEEARKLEKELEDKLRPLQHASLREMEIFSVNIDVPQERERIVELFFQMDFSSSLKNFALLASSPMTENLKADALKEARENPLSNLWSVKHLDDEGRTIVGTPGLGSEEPPEGWYSHSIARMESLRRAFVAANAIDPVRTLINSTVAIEERHFRQFVSLSPFVPQDQATLYALGFARFFQGDFASAAYLLFPRLEPSLRHILRANGADPIRRRDDGTEEDQSLDAMIANHRAALLQILGAPLLDELDRVFNSQPGPTLRHDVAHGQLTDGECYSAHAIYACWLLYRVCCLFVMEKWEDWVRPALEAEEPGR